MVKRKQPIIPDQPDLSDISIWTKWVFQHSHKGRVGRLEYIKNRLLLILSFGVLGGLAYLVWPENSSIGMIIVGVTAFSLYVVLGYRSITLDIQRLHDLGVSGWWMLAVWLSAFVPAIGGIISLIYLIILIFVPGNEEPNKFDIKTGNSKPNDAEILTDTSKAIKKKPAKVIRQPSKSKNSNKNSVE